MLLYTPVAHIFSRSIGRIGCFSSLDYLLDSCCWPLCKWKKQYIIIEISHHYLFKRHIIGFPICTLQKSIEEHSVGMICTEGYERVNVKYKVKAWHGGLLACITNANFMTRLFCNGCGVKPDWAQMTGALFSLFILKRNNSTTTWRMHELGLCVLDNLWNMDKSGFRGTL